MAIKRVRQAFAYPNAYGVMTSVPAGTLVNTDTFDGYKGRERLFEDVDTYMSRQEENKSKISASAPKVEEATANPGEKREVTSPPAPKREFRPPPTKKE